MKVTYTIDAPGDNKTQILEGVESLKEVKGGILAKSNCGSQMTIPYNCFRYAEIDSHSMPYSFNSKKKVK